jgi:hypothetical protein
MVDIGVLVDHREEQRLELFDIARIRGDANLLAERPAIPLVIEIAFRGLPRHNYIFIEARRWRPRIDKLALRLPSVSCRPHDA